MSREPTAVAPGADWDGRVASWDAVAGSAAFQRLAGEVTALARPGSDDDVADLGAGTGLLSLALAPHVATVTAVDTSTAMLERLTVKARLAGLGNISPLVGDLRSLPLPDESVTLAVSNYAFHHLDDAGKELALSEVRRVLAPGGRLVVCDMMFSLSLRRRDRELVARKLWLLARRGPAGGVRIASNLARLARGRWEQPAAQATWQRMLVDRHFVGVSVRLLEQEAGVAIGRRAGAPTRPLTRFAGLDAC